MESGGGGTGSAGRSRSFLVTGVSLGRISLLRAGEQVMRRVCLVATAVMLGNGVALVPGPVAAVRGQPAGPKPGAAAVPAKELADFQSRLSTATTKHLDLLLDPRAKVAALKGKSADGATAL